MPTIVELPDSVYRRAQQAAQTRGVSVDALISEVLEREVGADPAANQSSHRVNFPLIHSTERGTLDLTGFNFDDLLA